MTADSKKGSPVQSSPIGFTFTASEGSHSDRSSDVWFLKMPLCSIESAKKIITGGDATLPSEKYPWVSYYRRACARLPSYCL